MLNLAISTSSSICSVALLEDERCIKELNIDNEKTHSERLMPLIDELLKSISKSMADINLISCDVGPGSFTGIRIGISTIKALAMPNNIPIASITSLEALAYNISSNSFICSLIDARNNQVYAGLFDNNYNLVGNYLADDINNVIKILYSTHTGNIDFVGNGVKTFQKLLQQNEIYDNNIHSKNVGLCGFRKFKSGIYETANSIIPNYLRPSQAERVKTAVDFLNVKPS